MSEERKIQRRMIIAQYQVSESRYQGQWEIEIEIQLIHVFLCPTKKINQNISRIDISLLLTTAQQHIF